MARGLADFDPDALRNLRLGRRLPVENSASMSADELGRAVGASKAQILAYENGHRVPDPPRIRALADALGVHPAMLMHDTGRKEWGVADIRRACGLRALDLVKELGISPKSYRRFEYEGIVPARRPRFLDDVAQIFGTSRRSLEIAINRMPAVTARQAKARHLIESMAERYINQPGEWKGPEAQDPDLLELSASYGRPVQRTRRVLTYELGELRQMLVRARRERVVADYDTDQGRQERARSAYHRWHALYLQDLRRIPLRLEQFHRSAQPSDAWQALVDLHEAEAKPEGPWAPSTLLAAPTTVELLPPSLVERRTVDGVAGCRLTSQGVSHVRTFRELYAALYPGIRRPQRSSSKSVSAHLRGGLSDNTFSFRQERFVIPQPAIDVQTRLAGSKGSPVEIILSARLRLHVGPAAWTIVVVPEAAADPYEPGQRQQ